MEQQRMLTDQFDFVSGSRRLSNLKLTQCAQKGTPQKRRFGVFFAHDRA
jgi:hypothetical protein